MENFVLYNPVKLHFGKGTLKGLQDAASGLGRRALLVYGRGSAQANGSFWQTIEGLRAAGIKIYEYGGIRANPVVEDVDNAAAIGRRKHVDMIVAVGGGSVIDTAKMISVTIPVEHSAWEFMEGQKKPRSAIPVIAVLTLAATGSEMNQYAVIQNDQLQKKIGYGNKLLYPRHSFLDPEFTLTVPRSQTAFGIADAIAHCLEAWFGDGEATLSDRITISIIREVMKNGPLLLDNLKDYDLRARIMYAATAALNGITMPGRKSGDWGVHDIGHCLSVKYDIAHGASLSIAYIAWLKLHKDRIPERIHQLGTALFSAESVSDTIYKIEYFFKVIGCPVHLSQLDIHPDEAEKKELFDIMKKNMVDGLVHKLNDEDYKFIIDQML